MLNTFKNAFPVLALTFVVFACSEDSGSEPIVDRIGIGGQCSIKEECRQDLDSLDCLTQFKGGYCGKQGCLRNSDCPENSVCVRVSGNSYCFRTCAQKTDCNANRDSVNQANCSSSFDLYDRADTMPAATPKVCIPPSSGT